MEDKRFEALKAQLFDWGLDYIEEFLGFEADGYSKDELDNMMDQAREDMDEELLEEFYAKFCV